MKFIAVEVINKDYYTKRAIDIEKITHIDQCINSANKIGYWIFLGEKGIEVNENDLKRICEAMGNLGMYEYLK